MEVWYNLYLPLWVRGAMTIEQLQLAVTRERITQEECDKIIATPQSV